MAQPEVVEAFVERSVYQSCRLLGVSKLDALMLHRADHLTAWNGEVWNALAQLKKKGVVGELGVSVQSPKEALTALSFDSVSILQIPFNILDYRWDSVIEKILDERKHRCLTIHVRSALLQGLLTTNHLNLWKRAKCPNADQVLEWLREQANNNCGGDVVELCLRFALSQDWIDGVVLGLDTKEQLLYNLKVMSVEPWSRDQLLKIVEDRPQVPKETLDPATWTKPDA